MRYIEVKYLLAVNLGSRILSCVARYVRARRLTRIAQHRGLSPNSHRRHSDGSSERATNFAKCTSQLPTSCKNSWADFMRNPVDAPYRVVRVFYILLLRENTTHTILTLARLILHRGGISQISAKNCNFFLRLWRRQYSQCVIIIF